MGEDARHVVDPAIDRDHRDAGVDRLLDGRRHGVDLVRADDDAIDALDDRRLDVGCLLGGVLPCPSLSISVMLPSASASARSSFCMWTKNGNAIFGEVIRVSGLSAWAIAGSARPETAGSAARNDGQR